MELDTNCTSMFSVRAGRSGDRISVGARFSAPFQTDLVPIGTESFPEVERLGRGGDHPPPPGAEVKKE